MAFDKIKFLPIFLRKSYQWSGTWKNRNNFYCNPAYYFTYVLLDNPWVRPSKKWLWFIGLDPLIKLVNSTGICFIVNIVVLKSQYRFNRFFMGSPLKDKHFIKINRNAYNTGWSKLLFPPNPLRSTLTWMNSVISH